MNIRRAIACTAVPLLLVLAGCSSEPGESVDTGTPTPDATAEDPTSGTCEGATVAYITPGLSIPFWRSLAVGIGRVADEVGATVTDYDSDLSASTQLQNAQDAITAGVDAIIISPTDSSSAPVVLETAMDAGVPVVIADIGTDSGEFVSFVKTDNIAGAAAAAEYLNELLAEAGTQNAEIGMIGISQTRQNGKDRTQGFTETVEAAGHSVLELLESTDYTRSEGMALAQDLLTANPDMVALFTQHDEATLGALTALETANALDRVILVGFDGSTDSLAAIEAGTVAGASMQQPVLMGNEAMRAVCDYLSGSTPEETIYVDTIMVTRENVAEIRDSVIDTVFAER